MSDNRDALTGQNSPALSVGAVALDGFATHCTRDVGPSHAPNTSPDVFAERGQHGQVNADSRRARMTCGQRIACVRDMTLRGCQRGRAYGSSIARRDGNAPCNGAFVTKRRCRRRGQTYVRRLDGVSSWVNLDALANEVTISMRACPPSSAQSSGAGKRMVRGVPWHTPARTRRVTRPQKDRIIPNRPHPGTLARRPDVNHAAQRSPPHGGREQGMRAFYFRWGTRGARADMRVALICRSMRTYGNQALETTSRTSFRRYHGSSQQKCIPLTLCAMGLFRKEGVGEVESSRNRIRQVAAERRRASS